MGPMKLQCSRSYSIAVVFERYSYMEFPVSAFLDIRVPRRRSRWLKQGHRGLGSLGGKKAIQFSWGGLEVLGGLEVWSPRSLVGPSLGTLCQILALLKNHSFLAIESYPGALVDPPLSLFPYIYMYI